MIGAREAAVFFGMGAVLGADQTAGPQWMLSQPLVVGALAGAVTGQPALGALVGLWGQLAWNGATPVGSLPNPDVSGGTLAGVLAAAACAPGLGLARAAVGGIFVAVSWGWLGIWPVFLNRRMNAAWTPWVLRAEEGSMRDRRVAAAQRMGWLVTASMCGVWAVLGGELGARLLPPLLALVPARGSSTGAGPSLPPGWLIAPVWALGVAAAWIAFRKSARSDWPWLAAGAALAFGLHAAGV